MQPGGHESAGLPQERPLPLAAKRSCSLQRAMIQRGRRLYPTEPTGGAVLEAIRTTKDRFSLFMSSARWLPPLLARCSLGFVFVQSGWGKIRDHDGTIAFFGELGFGSGTPFVAQFVPWTEFIAGALLVFGCLTDAACVALIIDMIVAIFVANGEKLHDAGKLFRFYDYLYIILMLWLLVAGPGPVAADAQLFRRAARERES